MKRTKRNKGVDYYSITLIKKKNNNIKKKESLN